MKKPTNPGSGQSVFNRQHRPQVKEHLVSTGENSMAAQNKMLSQHWGNLSEADKTPYFDRAETEKAIYRQELDQWNKYNEAKAEAVVETIKPVPVAKATHQAKGKEPAKTVHFKDDDVPARPPPPTSSKRALERLGMKLMAMGIAAWGFAQFLT